MKTLEGSRTDISGTLRALLLGFVLVVLFLALGLKTIGAESTSVALFRAPAPKELAQGKLSAVRSGPEVVRTAFVLVNFPLLGDETGPGPSKRLSLDLFPEVIVEVEYRRTETSILGFAWVGETTSEVGGFAVFSVVENVLAGGVLLPRAFYSVEHVSGALYAIHEIDRSSLPPEGDPLDRPDKAGAEVSRGSGNDDGSLIDVMVAYTTDARIGAGGTADILAEINAAVTWTNQCYENSDVAQRLRMVHSEEVAYTESAGDLSQELNDLVGTSDGQMDNLHDLRDAHAADVVVLITETGTNCGLADAVMAEASSAFCVVKRSCASDNLTFPHELGHLMGARHDWYVDNATSPYSYAHGYVDPGRSWRTVMAYYHECTDCAGSFCSREPYFSNPDIEYLGDPTGVAAGTDVSCATGDCSNPSCDADVARTFDETAQTVANFRDSPEGVDAALVIDRSGSMNTAEKLPKAKEGAKYFVDSARLGDQIAVSSFAGSGTLVNALTEITNADPAGPIKTGIKANIDAMTASGSTNFGAGLQIAYDELDSSATLQPKFAVLMSDGHHNTGTYATQVQAFDDAGWSIHTIAFGSDADDTTLRQIADDTGGLFYKAETTNLTMIYDLIRAQMTSQAVLAALQWLLQLGQTITHYLPPLSPWSTVINFLLSWAGSDVDLILIRPDGTEVTPADAALDPDITYYKAATYAFYTVNNPEPGSWGVRISGTDLPDPEIVTLSVTAASPVVAGFYGFQAAYAPGDVIPIAVQLREQDASPILGANVQVDVKAPNGTVQTLVLLDDGAHDDLLANDGIYGGEYTSTLTEGFYGLDVSATGNYSGGPFSIQIVGRVLVGEPPSAEGFFDFEYANQASMDGAGWTRSGLWHLADEATCASLSPVPVPFPSSTHAAHFGDLATGAYESDGSMAPRTAVLERRAQQPEASPLAQEARSFGELISPEIQLTLQDQIDLRFQHFRSVEYYADGPYDKTYVQAQFDGGAWQTVWGLDSRTPSQGAWVGVGPIPIPVPAGATVMQLKFVFDSVDNYGNDGLGWLIDDVSVSAPGPVALTISTQYLPTGKVGLAYSASLSASGGTPPYAWTSTGLPEGFALDPASGTISGDPTTAGTYDVTVTVTDAVAATASRQYQLQINPAEPPPVGILFEEDFADTGGWTMSGLWHTTAALGCADLTGYGTSAYYGIGDACDYDTGARTTGVLTSPVIDVTGAVAVRVRFDHLREVEPFGDGAYDLTLVEAKRGNGSWEVIWARDSTSPSTAAWEQATTSSFATDGADSLQIRFVFDTVDQWANDFLGWLVDNVFVDSMPSGTPLSLMSVLEAVPRGTGGRVEIFNAPNPVREDGTEFVVRGVDATVLQVEVYDLSGTLVWEGQTAGNELPWDGVGTNGERLANGVYLYKVSVQMGDAWLVSEIRKLVILR